MAASSEPIRALDFMFGAGMAFLAGGTDVYGLGRLHDLFVSFMSGNTTMLAVAIGRGDWARVAVIAGVIALFVAGAAAGSMLSVVAGARHRAVVSLAVTLILAVPLGLPGAEVPAFVVAMGALNAAMTKVGRVSVSLTYVTGTLVKLGQGIGQALCGKIEDVSWLWQLPMWASLLCGAVAAAVLRGRLGEDAEWPLPLLAALLTGLALLEEAGAAERRAD